MRIKKDHWLNAIGIFLIILGIVHLIQTIFTVEPIHVFWLCNHVLLFMGVAILFRSSFWLRAEFLVLFLGQFIWIINFIFRIFNSAFVVVDYRITFIPALVHLLTLPLGFVAIMLLKKNEKSAWKGSLLHMLVLFPFVLYFGSYYNLNCLFNPCVTWIPNMSLYPFFIFLVYLVFIIFLNYLINWIIKKSSKR
ncbi:MAG: hypothetical protein ABIE36_03665 [Candidatus Diapherotrites archaeon]